MTEELETDEIYIQLGENRTGLGICLQRWQETPFEGGIKYTRAQPKYKRVDLEEMYKNTAGGDEWRREYATGYNTAIDEIKSKYGDLYTIERE